MVVFDVAHVFRMFGGPKALLDAIEGLQPGTGLGYNTVQMWSQRTTIPARWLGVVLYCIKKQGWSVMEFLTDEDDFVV